MALRDGQKSSERRIMQHQSLRSVVSSFFFQMILFLQGASHAGKTMFARHLAKLTGASVMSLELLKMGLI